MRFLKIVVTMPLVFLCVQCVAPATRPGSVETIARFCEQDPFVETDLALRWQVPDLPETVTQAIANLQESGSTEHMEYLSYLFLRDYENQLAQYGSGYTLAPGLPKVIIDEFRRLLGARQIQVSAAGDWTSSTYASVILEHSDLVAGYPRAERLAAKLRRMQADLNR